MSADQIWVEWGLKGYVGFNKNLQALVEKRRLTANERTAIEVIVGQLQGVLDKDRSKR